MRHKIETRRPANGLEAVSGDADRDNLTDGCAATVKKDCWCSLDDSCWHWEVTYDNEEHACVYGVRGHDWGPVRRAYKADFTYYRIRNRGGKQAICSENGEVSL